MTVTRLTNIEISKMQTLVNLIYGGCLLLFMGLQSSCGLVRSVVLLTPNTDDYRHDPQQNISPPPIPYHFHHSIGSENLGSKIMVPSTTEAQKINLDAFVQLHGTEAFVIIRNDTIIYEVYPNNRTPFDPVSSFSISKAVMTTLTGIAISEGAIKSLDQRVCEILPEWEQKGFKHLRIMDLMQHTSGMKFSKSIYNPASDQVQFYYGRNLRHRMGRRKPDLAPGETFDYQSANTLLPTMVIEKATGLSIAEFLETRLWQPLGMESAASWSQDRKGKKGMVRTFCCLQGMALDFAKLGRLWLNQGRWDDQQLLPQDWMNTILKHGHDPSTRYRSGFRIVNNESNIFYTSGLLGQYIYIFPEKNLIILRFGEHRERYMGRMWRKVFTEIYEQV